MIARHALHKLSPLFYEPLWIVERTGEVAYRLNLSNEARIQNVSNVSLLKSHRGDLLIKPADLPLIHEETTISDPPRDIIRARRFKGQY